MFDFGSMPSIISLCFLILICFIILRFFRFLFSLSFVGFILSLVSYFIYDYKFNTIPVIACISLIFSVCGFTKSSVIGKVFALFGGLISGYIILHNYGII